MMTTRAERRGQHRADENNRLLAGDLIAWLESRVPGYQLTDDCRQAIREYMSSAFRRGIARGKKLEARRLAAKKRVGDV